MMRQPDAGPAGARDRGEAAAALHRRYARLRWTRCRGRRAKLSFLLRGALRPLAALTEAVQGTRAYGRQVARIAGVPRFRQLLHQWAIGTRYGFDRDAYYRYRLYRLPDVRSAALFLPLKANIALRGDLYDRLGLEPSRLADKCRFYRTCLDHGLPLPPMVAEFEAGEVRWWPGNAEGVLPERDLFSKEANNIKGRGAARWIWQGGGRYRDEKGTVQAGTELIEHLRRQSWSAPYVLQVRLLNHPRIAPLAPETLCTVRVVTYRRAGGAPRHLASTFRMAGGPFPADNFSQRGLASPVAGATGELQPAVYKDLHATAVAHAIHPATGSAIAGLRLPHWDQAIELALRAHELFHEFPSVGWDVAITADGPVLVEGNYNWNVVLTQQAGGRGLGETDFFASYLSYFDGAG